MQLYKATEWEDPIGQFFVNNVSDLAGIAGKWWVPARMLGISPADYILLLKDKFNANIKKYNKEADLLVFSFDSLKDARKYKNWINREARTRNFMV